MVGSDPALARLLMEHAPELLAAARKIVGDRCPMAALSLEWEDGETYPLAKVEISSQSHPFYTGKQILVDSGGRVERFRRRYDMTVDGSARSTVPSFSFCSNSLSLPS